jgi:RNA polymerase sigma-70 factor, ECF subfamily
VTESDDVLVDRSRRGDRPAFEQLVARTARLVFARLYLQVRDRHQAEDLTQETFLTAWRAIHQLKQVKDFRPWLLAIAKSTAADDQRRRGRQKRSATLVGEQAIAEMADEMEGPSAAAERRENRQRMLEAIASLPPEYRQVVSLRYIGGADYAAIAQQLALTNGSLRGLLHRGMAMLREKLSPPPAPVGGVAEAAAISSRPSR